MSGISAFSRKGDLAPRAAGRLYRRDMAGPERAHLDLAERFARAQRRRLLGRRAPWLARAASGAGLPADLGEHGAASVRAVALAAEGAVIDEGLARLAGARAHGGAREVGTPMEALWRLAVEPEGDARGALAASLSRSIRDPALALAGAFARVLERAAEAGLPEVASEADERAAKLLIAATEDPVRDVLDWATVRLGRGRREKLSWSDSFRALWNRPAELRLRPAADPWPALAGWRARIGAPLEDDVGLEAAPATIGWGSWAVRAGGKARVGVAAPPGAPRWRLALQSIGRWDALREGGRRAFLPADPASAELLPSLWPLLLADRLFLERGVGAPGVDLDDVRRLALSELLCARLGAAAVLVRRGFQESRSVEGARGEAADRFRVALYAPIAPELGLLLCAPWQPSSSEPRAILAAIGLASELRERFDVDWWRNPRVWPELRRIASEAGTATLPPQPAERAPLDRWIVEKLGA